MSYMKADGMEVYCIMVRKGWVTPKAMVEEYRISGFPSVYIIDPRYDNRVHIDSPYLDSVKSLSTEVGRYARVRELIEKGSACK